MQRRLRPGPTGLMGLYLVGIGTYTSALAQEAADSGLQEIVVTAQRREQRIQDVPVSIAAMSQEQMDAQGVRNVDDIAKLTPGITFRRADERNGAMSTIAIRGIDSQAGASTTGVYIDDTPIQIRALGAGGAAFNAFPNVFDLDRVEVLRGPQGTLFGSGSEGGTVRFITPQPDLVRTSAYSRAELSYTEHGDPSFEAGAAFGAPLIEDKLGLRVSAWFRRDGGWVNRNDWDRSSVQSYPPTAPTPASVTTLLSSNSNWQNAAALRAAMTYKPFDGLTITPSIFYQRTSVNDTLAFWSALSDPDNGRFVNGNNQNAPSTDHFYLPALKVEWAFANMRLVSNTSYFNRNSEAVNDYTMFETSLWGQALTTVPGLPPSVRPYLNGPYYPSGFTPASSFQGNQQNNISQELRLQSDDPSARINWVVGFFYSHNRQTAVQIVSDPGLHGFISNLTGGLIAPDLENGLYTFVQNPVVARDDQKAVYAQADVKLTQQLTLTAGIRAADTKFDATANYHGFVVGPPVNDSGSQHEHPITPKAGLSYKINDQNMVYASASKGYRIGGYNPRVGTTCGTDPNAPGYHTLYSSDSVWSYEAGAKSELLDHRLRINTSFYVIDWKNIQQLIQLSSCGFAYTSNLGKARSQGLDLQADLAITHDLIAGVAVGYNDAKYTQTVKAVADSAVNLATNGDHIAGWPWTVSASLQYNFKPIGDRAPYLRLDYQYQTRQSDLVSANNPQNGSFQPWNIFELPTTSQLAARAGVRFNEFDLSLFCNNLTNSHPILSSTPSVNFGIPGGLVGYFQSTFRPRTYGATVSYRF